jgi:hypothetical protein
MPAMSDGDAHDVHAARILRDVAEAWSRDPQAALARLDAALDDGDVVGGPQRARLEARRGQLRTFLGRLELAEAGLRRARRASADPYLDLQLVAVLGWRGDAAARREAAELLPPLRAQARRLRDGPLAIAAACLAGESALRDGDADAAARAYGEALGISEFASSEAASVAPLAGLATAHARGRAPGKAAPMARRALERARRVGDRAGVARSLAALAEAERRSELFLTAADEADAAPHRPLALACRVAAAEAGRAAPDDLAARARTMGAHDLGARAEAAAATRR